MHATCSAPIILLNVVTLSDKKNQEANNFPFLFSFFVLTPLQFKQSPHHPFPEHSLNIFLIFLRAYCINLHLFELPTLAANEGHEEDGQHHIQNHRIQ